MLAAPTSALARSWTTPDGKVIEAELVEITHQGKSVILDMKGQRFEVPVDKLSSKDRAYVEGVYDASDKRSDAEIKKEVEEAAEEDAQGKSKPQSVRLTARRTWTDRTGNTMDAQFVRLIGSTVLLRNGSNYQRIPYYELSTKDRQFIFDGHVAMNQTNLVPPVRPDLLDTSAEGSMSPYQEGSPAPSETTETSEKPSEEEGEKLPPSGFGSDTQLPPSGFGSDVKLPPSGFGAVETSESTAVTLPPSGFGDTGAADSGDVKLPSSGFGDTGSMASTDTPSPKPNGGRPPKVGVPRSTIVGDDGEVEMSEGEGPLFDVASVPDRVNENSGNEYTGFPSSDVAKADTSRKPSKEDKPANTPTNTGNASTNAFGSTSAPSPNKPRNPGPGGGNAPGGNSPGGSPKFGSAAQMMEDFEPIVAPVKRELTTADYNMQMFAVALLSIGSLMMSGGYMWLIAMAFLDSIEWGLRSLIPGMAVMFGFSEWDKASTPLLSMLLGICLTLGGFGMLLGVT
ncbi:hypothetical protein [Blastopirellula marina]|uniref:SLA1 homology domain-containing protein n=1 Tax=Blastopirellula marina TaxID=124 RepID=A0A2S8GD15_9BACT|nr:hypothetical protein [Blastopirellula marina]PQO42329.1 hypothetical protein C5Y93_28755 [Blastopirellula marina]